MCSVTFHHLSPRLQQAAAWRIEDEAPYNPHCAQHPDPAEYTYVLWPGDERIQAILLGEEIIYAEHEEEPAYDLAYCADLLKAHLEELAEQEQHDFLNQRYRY